MQLKNITAFKRLLEERSHKVVLVSHQNPDGDAVGSSLAMARFLAQKGHTVQIIMPNEIPSFLRWMPGYKKIINYEYHRGKTERLIKQATLLCALDFNDFSRVGKQMQPFLEKYEKTIILIDHHQNPSIATPYAYSQPNATATCEMIFDFIVALGETDKIDADIATVLYTGIMTDTGSFKFPLTSAHTHEIIVQLIKKGADNVLIHDRVFNANSPERLKLLGVALKNMVVLPEFHTAYITLSETDLAPFDIKKGDTEGFVNYVLSLKGIYFAAIFIADTAQKNIKISFRSRGDFSVNDFARSHFLGGGHKNAAGAHSLDTIEKTVERFLKLLPDYKQALVDAHTV